MDEDAVRENPEELQEDAKEVPDESENQTSETPGEEDSEVNGFRKLLDELFEEEVDEEDDCDTFFDKLVDSKVVNVVGNVVAVLLFIGLAMCAALFIVSGCSHSRYGDELTHLTLVLGLMAAFGGFFYAIAQEKPQAFAALALSAGMVYASFLTDVALEESIMVAIAVLISGALLCLTEAIRYESRWSICCQVAASSLVSFFATMCLVHLFF